ncbi:hypothetical protein QC762_506755 [Podospora pseudocomata]|uniref:Uncharacterized protein n=1 Tax=Podospora pseudocomata TaxID=2093779 RepID=A0ABR0GCF9_9PEZI|nr:hypothetical protein QC762_506755 [Podospora pseudocomata]
MSTSTVITDFLMQVWRYTPRGWNYKDNEGTAQFLAQNCDLKGWTVHPASLTSIHDQDSFVPLEVNFRFKGSAVKGARRVYDHLADLRELFEAVLPSKIEEFFLAKQQNSTAHHMVLVPVGKISPEVVHKNTRIRILRSLEVRTSTVVERNLITPIDMCNLALEVVRGSAIGADLATMVRTLPAKWMMGSSMVQEFDKLRKSIQMNQPEVNGPLKTVEDVTNAWNKAEPCLDLMSTIIRHIEDCLDLSRIPRQKNIPPQQLYETMLGLRNATIFFSAYEDQMLSIAAATPTILRPPNGAKTVVGATATAVMVAAALMVYTFFTGGTGLIIAGGASGAILGGGATAGIGAWKRNKHASLCESFSRSIINLGKALTDANICLAATYSSQVLQFPLHSSHCASGQRDEILRQLGVDTRQLKREAYQRPALEKNLETVLNMYNEFLVARAQVQKEARVRTRQGLTPNSPAQPPQGLQIRSAPRPQNPMPVVSKQRAIGSISTPSARLNPRQPQPRGASPVAVNQGAPGQQRQPQQRKQPVSLPAAPSQQASGSQPRPLPIQLKNDNPSPQSRPSKNAGSSRQSQQSKTGPLTGQSRANPAGLARSAPKMKSSTTG